ncbi:hypothetical protein [Pseudoalteromonas ostreae]|uniref:hypothetical protein n=1 Tax=Pseudoalteromonas ostreae TaxID=2774154 RepID=UPI001B392DC0|nr:hypothetical protein [Pseudoalteromonas ostreae]
MPFERNPIIISSSPYEVEVTHPQNIFIRFEDHVRVSLFDLGIVAYEKFSTSSKNFSYIQKRRVYIPEGEKLKQGRIKLINAFLDYLSTTSNSGTTKLLKASHILKFTLWFIENGHPNFLETKTEAVEAFIYWTRVIEYQVKQKSKPWGQRTAAQNQASLTSLLVLRFGESFRFRLNQAIYKLKSVEQPIEVRSVEECREVMNSLIDIAIGLTGLIVEERKFPYLMKYQNEDIYVFPNEVGTVKTKHSTKLCSSYNYEKGHVYTHEEMLPLKKKDRPCALWTTKDAVKNLEYNNTNMTSHVRMRLLDLACCCYLEVFLIITGIHRSEVLQLECCDEINCEKPEYSNEFRAVKLRARGKVTSYRLHRNGVKVLKAYLILRKWVTNIAGAPLNESLFIRYIIPSGKQSLINKPYVRPIKEDDIGRVYNRLEGRFFPTGFKVLTVREVRRIKTVHLHDIGVSINTIADVLNHSVEVSKKVYSNTKTSQQSQELLTFWRSVKKAAEQVKIVSDSNKNDIHSFEGGKSIAIGHCVDFNNPQPMYPSPMLEPNCKTQYGCLFCNKYCLHVDKKDLHKLLSLSFVVSSVKSKSLYLDNHMDFINRLHIRIHAIVEQLKNSSVAANEIFEDVNYLVWELGELTPFWELRLRRYESMGVIF